MGAGFKIGKEQLCYTMLRVGLFTLGSKPSSGPFVFSTGGLFSFSRRRPRS